jgi:hypothetical protein
MRTRMALICLRWRIGLRHFQVPHDKLAQILGLEILSFISLYTIAMGLLTYHRFYAAIALFSLGCATLAVATLMAFFTVENAIARWICIALTITVMVSLTFYLTGVVNQAEGEYYAPLISRDAETSKFVAQMSRPSTAVKPNADDMQHSRTSKQDRRPNALNSPQAPSLATPLPAQPSLGLSDNAPNESKMTSLCPSCSPQEFNADLQQLYLKIGKIIWDHKLALAPPAGASEEYKKFLAWSEPIRGGNQLKDCCFEDAVLWRGAAIARLGPGFRGGQNERYYAQGQNPTDLYYNSMFIRDDLYDLAQKLATKEGLPQPKPPW